MTTRSIVRSGHSSAGIELLFVLSGLGAGLGSAFLVSQFKNPLIALGLGLGLIVALGTIARPGWGLYALVLMTYVRFSDVMIRYHQLPSTAQPFIALVIVAIVIRWALSREVPSGWASSALLVLLYGLVGLGSLLYAHDYTTAMEVMSDYLKDAIIAIVLTVLLQRYTTLRGVIWTLLAAGLFMSGISIFQQLTGTFSDNYWGFGLAHLQNIVGNVNDYRISGPIGDANYFAQILVVLVPLAYERMLNERSRRLRLLAFLALGGTVLTIIFTFSRDGFLALIVVGAFMMLRHPPRPIALLLVLATCVAVLQFLPDKYIERLQTVPESIPFLGGDVRNEISLRGRTSEGTVALLMFMDHPVLGVGWGNYPTLYQDYAEQIGLDEHVQTREPHSLYLEIAAETGVVGLVVFGFLLWNVFRGLSSARAKLERTGNRSGAALVSAFQVGFIGYLTAAIFLHNAYPRFFWLLFGIALAIPTVAQNEWNEASSPAGAIDEVMSDSGAVEITR